MSIVILVGGRTNNGNPEHRFLVDQFLQAFPDEVKCIVTTNPVQRSLSEKIKRTLKRGGYLERLRRSIYNRQNPGDDSKLGELLFPHGDPSHMPGGERVTLVDSHNSQECVALLQKIQPKVIVVYGTVIIRDHIAVLAKKCTLNMHTGLSPYYRGDSTLFWPVYYNQKDKLGVTVHELIAEVDGGGIVSTGTVNYEKGDTEAHIFAKGVRTGTALYIDAVRAALNDSIVFHEQDLSLGQEFRWIHRTVAAEKQVKRNLDIWAKETN